jgi:competence protein ComEA
MDRVADGQVANEVSAEAVTRPAPMEPITDRVRAWVAWFGLARIVVSAVSMLIVCAGAFWLVRSPPPSAEAILPQASSGVAPSSTLPLPAGQLIAAAEGSGPVTLPAEVLVHVAGAVARPGVYLLAAGARVDDAVGAAGGPTTQADVDALNLAAVVVDGVRVYVPEHGEVIESLPLAPTGSGAVTAPSGPVDINRADASRLDALPGVGPTTAASIVAERERNGPFLTVDDLERVPGIGPAKLSGLRDLVIA